VVFLAVVAAIGPLLLLVGGAITLFGTLATAFAAVVPVVGAVAAAIFALGAPLLIIIAIVVALAIVIFTHWNQIIDWTSNMMLKVAGIWNEGWSAASKFLTGILDGIGKAVTTAVNFIEGLLDGLFAKVSSVAKAIMSPISAITGAVGSVAGGIGNAVGGAIKAFATGGIVTSPTYALVGEAGPEAIIPLSAFAGGGSLAGAGGSTGGGNIVVNIMGGSYLDSNGATMIANAIGQQIVRQLRLKNFN
jgi:hypothetical protein